MKGSVCGKWRQRIRSRHGIAPLLILYDVLAVNISYFFALWVHFEGRFSLIPKQFLSAFLKFAPIYTVSAVLVFWFCKLYESAWQIAGKHELLHVAAASAVLLTIQTVGITVLFRRMPLGYYVFGVVTQSFLTALVRLVLLPGASRGAGEMPESRVMDDIPDRWSRYVDTGRNPAAAPSASLEDLLGRKAVQVKMDEVFQTLSGKVIMVTGGGGSIGGELCRQIAAHEPKRLIIFDVYENSAYAIQLELKEKYPELDLVTLIGSVRDSRRLMQVFDTYKPEVVYHAAAHKHVPLMEDSPCESIKNNTIGTYKTAYAAMACGCRRFVLVSTDKAVNPTSIMGASKRLCEMVIQSFDRKIRDGTIGDLPALFTHREAEGGCPAVRQSDMQTEFVAVRFGNVLGSNGSVLPLFEKQISHGGPVTVTHPDAVRYFMTIPEAVSLVLQAGTYARGGEIFVLDMGSPVRIDALARNLIRLSGYKPGADIEIVYTGLRPGEKLYEEKLMSEEGVRRTHNRLIYAGSPIPFDADAFLEELGRLMEAAYENEDDIIEDIVAEMVPTYHPARRSGEKDAAAEPKAG